MDIKKRIADARKVMNQKQIDCLVLAPSTDLFYMTGFCGTGYGNGQPSLSLCKKKA